MPLRPTTTATAGAALCVVALVVLHLVEPGLNPRDHMVSEYANSSAGWLGTAALAAWSVALVATSWTVGISASTWWSSQVARRAIVGLLVLAAVGMAITACFPTQAVAGRVPAGVPRTTAGVLHDVSAGGATVAMFVAAAINAVTARDDGIVRVSRGVVVAAVVVQAILLVVGPSVDGIRQRLLIALALTWLVVVNMRVASLHATDQDTETAWNHERH